MAGLRHSLDLTGPAGDLGSRVHRLDPRAKIVGLFGVTVVAVTTPVEAWPVWVACAAVLMLVAAVARVPPRELHRRGRWVLAPVLLVAATIPLARGHDGRPALAAVASKATIGTLAAVLFTCTTSFSSALHGLERMRAPRLLTLIASLMYRYLFVIAGELARVRAALVARGYRPRNALQAGAIGRVASAGFLRSYGRGERVHRAMLARGYANRIPHLEQLAFGRPDAAFVVAVALALIPLRVLL